MVNGACLDLGALVRQGATVHLPARGTLHFQVVGIDAHVSLGDLGLRTQRMAIAYSYIATTSDSARASSGSSKGNNGYGTSSSGSII